MFANIAIRHGAEKPIHISHDSILEARIATLERVVYAFIRSQPYNGTPSGTLVETPTRLGNYGRDTPILSDTKNNAAFEIEAEKISATERLLPDETVDPSIPATLKEYLADSHIVEQGLPSESAEVQLGTQESHVDVQETRPSESKFAEVESIKTAKALSDTAVQLRVDWQARLEALEVALVTPSIDLQAPVGEIKGTYSTSFQLSPSS